MALIDPSFLSSLSTIFYVVAFIGLFVYGQRIQLLLALRGLRTSISKLEKFQLNSRNKLLNSLSKFLGPSQANGNAKGVSLSDSVDRLVGSFVIAPVSLDPSGIIPKMEHVLDTADENLRTEIRRIAPKANEPEVYNLSNLAEITIGLNNLYRIARHFYLLGSKQGGSLAIFQLQMQMPQIMETAKAYDAAMDAFAQAKTIGDGFGPLVASGLVSRDGKDTKTTWEEIVKDTNVAKMTLANRTVYVVKASGPGGNVGRPVEAVEKLISRDANVKFILTVDAALKLEGEETGEIAEGVGTAIGGPGVDRYRVEEVATRRGIPTLALVSKLSEKEAITEIPKAVRDKVPSAVERIEEIVRENVPEDGSVIVAGIGNTLGVE
jgi:hypothetical protein